MTTYYLNDWKGNTFNGEFKEVTAQSYEVFNNGVVPNVELIGNYVVFRNISATNFSIRMKNVWSGTQAPLNMPVIAGVQIVAGGQGAGIIANGDYDKDVVIGDNGLANYTIDVPYGIEDRVDLAKNKVYEAISNVSRFVPGDTHSQSDYIVTGRNQDLVIGGNGNDSIDAGVGDDVVLGDNAKVEMVDYNPIDSPAIES